jgi:hypothetical protein
VSTVTGTRPWFAMPSFSIESLQEVRAHGARGWRFYSIGKKSPAALFSDSGFVAGRKRRGFCGLPSRVATPEQVASFPTAMGAAACMGA